MSDPSLGLTYDDFRIRVAEFLGVAYYGAAGDQAAQIPVDTHDLDLVSRIVNDGYARFIGENPLWNFLTVPFTLQFVLGYSGTATGGSTTTLIDTGRTEANSFFNGFGLRVTHADSTVDTYTVTTYTSATHTFAFSAGVTIAAGDTYTLAGPTAVEGQNYRYYMPDDFYGILVTPLTYDVGGPRLTINEVAESTIRELRAGSNTTGTVSSVAFRAINTTATTTAKRWEALFWPAPASVSRVTGLYKRFPQKLSSGTDRSVAGFQHDRAILAACVAEAERQRGDAIGPREQAYQAMLERAMKLDARASEARAKEFGDRSEDRAPFGRRPLNYYGVSTYNGSTIP